MYSHTKQKKKRWSERIFKNIIIFIVEILPLQCNTIVAQYGPVIAQLIAQLVDPKKICEVGYVSSSGYSSRYQFIQQVYADFCCWFNFHLYLLSIFLQEIGLCSAKTGVKQSHILHLLEKLKPAAHKDTKLYFKSKQHLLGKKECTFGPAYWCASVDNARKCQVIYTFKSS
jgi:ABC-type polysaccharide transport system permease subunit